MQVRHAFVSAKQNGPDPSVIQPSHWNASHNIDAPNNINIGEEGVLLGLNESSYLTLGAIKSTAALQYLRRNIANTQYEFGPLPNSAFLLADDYNFTQQAPPENLSPSLKSFTLSPVPRGVNGSNLFHDLGIFNNSGVLQERIRISGGTAISGANSGTILASTIVGTYTAGNYKIGSLTGGIQEALTPSVAGNLIIKLTSAIYLQGAVNFPSAGFVSIVGFGMSSSSVIRHANYPTGNLFQTNGGSTWIYLANFHIGNGTGLGTSGASVLYDANGGGGYSVIENLLVIGGSVGIKIQSGSNINLRNVKTLNYDGTSNPIAGLHLTAVGSTEPFGIVASDCTFASHTSGTGLLADAVDGLLFSNCAFGGNYGIWFRGVPGGSYLANCIFSNPFIDAPTTTGIIFTNNGTGSNIQSVFRFVGGHINGQFTTTGGTSGLNIGVDIGATNTTFCDYVEFIGTYIANFKYDGAYIARVGADQISFKSCSIFDVNLGNAAGKAGFVIANGVTGLDIVDCTVYNTVAGFINYAIVQLGTLDKSNIQGNRFAGMKSANFYIGGTITNSIRKNNAGEDNVIPVVTSAATFVFPTNPNFTISGAANLLAANVTSLCPGSGGTLRATDASLTITAGGVWGNTITLTQNLPFQWMYDGTKVWVK